MSKQTPPHHHLITAFRNWMMENFDIVHIHVDVQKVTDPFVIGFANNGIVSLNVTDRAVQGFYSGSQMVSFGARFSGESRHISIPPTSVVGLMGFNKDDDDEPHFVPLPEWTENKSSPEERNTKKKPTLSVVK